MLKALEQIGKTVLALVAGLLLFRFGRRSRAAARLTAAKKVLLVRIDNRVGEALLTTPLLDALKAAGGYEVHLLVHAKTARVLEGHPAVDRLIPFDRSRLVLGAWAPGVSPLRAADYDVVLDCSNWTAPSVTAALVARLAAPRSAVIGPAVFPVTVLQDVKVVAKGGTRSEVEQRLHLLSPFLGQQPYRTLSFRTPRTTPDINQFLSSIQRPYAVVNPGGRLGERRVPAEAFAAAARTLMAAGVTPVVTWGPGEEALADEVVKLCVHAVRAPKTSIDELAALMRDAKVTVCNNTGPMHLSVAVGTPTLAFFRGMEMDRWGHDRQPHLMVDLTAAIDSGVSDAASRAVTQMLEGRT